MITKRTKFLVILAGAGLAATASAQELMVFPNDGQDKEQQQQDEFTCYNWAKGETGFDPMVVPTATAPPPQQSAPKGGVRRGAVRGAAIGAVAGGNSSDIGKAAAVGATAGAMRRQDQKRKEDTESQQWEQEQVRIYEENRNRYNRAYSACMEGKNYTVR